MVNVHNFEKPYPCVEQNCYKKFLDRRNLKDHLRKDHGEAKLVCGFENCAATFTSQNSLWLHKKKYNHAYKWNLSQCSSYSKLLNLQKIMYLWINSYCKDVKSSRALQFANGKSHHSSLKCKTAWESVRVGQNCMQNVWWPCGVSKFSHWKHLYNGVDLIPFCTFPKRLIPIFIFLGPFFTIFIQPHQIWVFFALFLPSEMSITP